VPPVVVVDEVVDTDEPFCVLFAMSSAVQPLALLNNGVDEVAVLQTLFPMSIPWLIDGAVIGRSPFVR
jgi:hypothetical protein